MKIRCKRAGLIFVWNNYNSRVCDKLISFLRQSFQYAILSERVKKDTQIKKILEKLK